MEDDRTRQITEWLRELPREQARPGFTARVLERLDAAPRATASRFSFRFALATAAVVLAAIAISAGVAGVLTRESQKANQARQALQEIRAEHGRLEQELREMTEPPVVYLGGDEHVDLVLDLGEVRSAQTVAPVAYRADTF
jgi:outer membrane murein-binding lipoprotein Lpp